jgi:hypothetical protein
VNNEAPNSNGTAKGHTYSRQELLDLKSSGNVAPAGANIPSFIRNPVATKLAKLNTFQNVSCSHQYNPWQNGHDKGAGGGSPPAIMA